MINPLKTKSFWIVLVALIFIIVAFGYLMYPQVITQCNPINSCPPNWPYDISSRFVDGGLSLLKVLVIPAIIVALIVSFIVKK